MPQLTPAIVRDHLLGIGYPNSQIVSDFTFGVNDHEQRISFAAFGQLPADARSACIAVLDSNGDSAKLVKSCLPMGAPVAIVCAKSYLEVWRQSKEPRLMEQVPEQGVSRFFDCHQDSLSPKALLRAKTRSRFEQAFQLTFVDSGLIPLIEEVVGPWLTRLLERVLVGLRSEIPEARKDWLCQAVFWLVAAKILKDKEVPKFQHLDLTDVRTVLIRVRDHYGASQLLPIPDSRHRLALQSASRIVSHFAGLRHVTTESLSHVYDNLLVTKNIRKELGTHSTPTFLIDYIIRRLTPEIERLLDGGRKVLKVIEPGCGHSAFLVAAMRLLKELSPLSGSDINVRDRLYGFELDDIAREIGRLSLTLANIPDPDGWMLLSGDFFERTELEEYASHSMILLANPPFEDFKTDYYHAIVDRAKRNDERVPIKNKAAEVLFRCISALPQDAVFGVVVPQGILEGVISKKFRHLLCQECELIEILLLPDDPKVFSYSDSESAVLLGRRGKPKSNRVRYSRLREGSISRFQSTFTVDEEKTVAQSSFVRSPSCSMWIPALSDKLWEALGTLPQLNEIAHIRRGMKYWSPKRIHAGLPRHSQEEFDDSVRGYINMRGKPHIHHEPRLGWLSINKKVVEIFRAGMPTGQPRVLVNYAPVGRGPWRLKAFLDPKGWAVTQNFVAIEPVHWYPIEFYWALLNSPLANAYVFATSRKRHVKEGTLAKMPVPLAKIGELRRLIQLVKAYRQTFGDPLPDFQVAAGLLLEIDAEVLRLYDLPVRVEREILDLFSGYNRLGVPFRFERYFPPDFDLLIPLHVYLSPAFRRSTVAQLEQKREQMTVEERELISTTFGGENR